MILSLVSGLVFTLYILCLVFVMLYCFIQVYLLLSYQKSNSNTLDRPNAYPVDKPDLPTVTIQLPIFNERYVVRRLIDHIILLEYPRDKLQIQVLDDSTDDTHAISEDITRDYQAQGIPIEYIHRPHREGFKAGALAHGLATASGSLIAIFDADFLPPSDFLLKTIPHFEERNTGVVQTRWEHLNGDYSIITRLQAFQLNAHFTIEQTGRLRGNYFLQFNGTAGLWRRETIMDAGGWQADTLTEDLDLSYRAQLRGWKIVYRQDIGSPSELPVEIHGLKSQQFRWMKGGAENACKHLPGVWATNLSLGQKLHATQHLLSSSVFLAIFLLAILSVPVMFGVTIYADLKYYGMFSLSLVAIGLVYFRANSDTMWSSQSSFKRGMNFIVLFPVFLSLSMGLSLHNSIAVLEGYLGRKSDFVRTPKYNILHAGVSFRQISYAQSRISLITVVEGVLAFLFLATAVVGIITNQFTFVIFHLMLAAGFGSIFFLSFRHLNPR